MIRLKGTFANTDEFLWPGQYVRATLIMGADPKAVVIPARAVQRGPKGTLVFVVKGDRTVEARAVQIARLVGDDAVVADGVSAGELIVTDGQNKLKHGATAAPTEPAAATAK
jgi:multidrug efflux system membrane fusion protein